MLIKERLKIDQAKLANCLEEMARETRLRLLRSRLFEFGSMRF